MNIWRFREAFASIMLSTMSLVSCSASPSGPTINVLDPELLAAYASYSSTWQQRRTTLEFDNGQSANDCAAYVELAVTHNTKETVFNQQVHGEYVICDALKLLGPNAKVEGGSAIPALGARLADGLDLRSFESSFNQRSDAERHTLSSLDPSHLKVEGATVEMETESWYFRVEVVALGDLNGNAVPDWIVSVVDEAKFGTYRGYSTVLVFDPGERRSFSGSRYPPLARDDLK